MKSLLAKNWTVNDLETKDKDNQEIYEYIKNNLKATLSTGGKISSSAMRFMLEMSKAQTKEVNKLTLSNILRMTNACEGMIDQELSGMIAERVGEIMLEKCKANKRDVWLDKILRGEGIEIDDKSIFRNLMFQTWSCKLIA